MIVTLTVNNSIMMLYKDKKDYLSYPMCSKRNSRRESHLMKNQYNSISPKHPLRAISTCILSSWGLQRGKSYGGRLKP